MSPSRLLLVALFAPLYASLAVPVWWWDGAPPDYAPILTNAPQNNEGPVVSGQLKHVANQARLYLEESLAGRGGAGPGIVAFTNNNPATNDTIVTVGQLKAVAKPFYERLREAGYNTREILRSNGYPSTWTSLDPWGPVAAVDGNDAPCTIGQLKLVFAFDLTDSDVDGLPNYWELLYGLNPYYASDAFADRDGDGYVALSEFQRGTDPNDYFNGTPPTSPPLAPSTVKAIVRADGRLDVSWLDHSTNEERFRIFHQPAGGAVSELGTAPANVQSVSISASAAGGVSSSSSVSVGAQNSQGTSTSVSSNPTHERTSPPQPPQITVARTFNPSNDQEVSVTLGSSVPAGQRVLVKYATFGSPGWNLAQSFDPHEGIGPKFVTLPFDNVYAFKAYAVFLMEVEEFPATIYSAPSTAARIKETRAVLTGEVSGQGTWLGGEPLPPAPRPLEGNVSLGGAVYAGPFDNITDEASWSGNVLSFHYKGSNSVIPVLTQTDVTSIGSVVSITHALTLEWDTTGFSYSPVPIYSWEQTAGWGLLRAPIPDSENEQGALPFGDLTSGGDGYDSWSHPKALMIRKGFSKQVGFTATPASLRDFPGAEFSVAAQPLAVTQPDLFRDVQPVGITSAADNRDVLAQGSAGGVLIAQLDIRSRTPRRNPVLLVDVRLLDPDGNVFHTGVTAAAGPSRGGHPAWMNFVLTSNLCMNRKPT